MAAALPAGDRAFVYPKHPSQTRVRPSETPASDLKPFGQGLTGRVGIVAEETDERWQEPEDWSCPAQLPVCNCGLVGPKAVGDLALKEAQVETALAEVISYRCKDLRVGTGWGPSGFEADMAERQRGDAGLSRRAT